MLPRHATTPWPVVQRLGDDVFRLGDGSLRALFECAAPDPPLRGAVDAVAGAGHPIQIVYRSRAATVVEGGATLLRLRASQAFLLAELRGDAAPKVGRLLVVVPWDAAEGGPGEGHLRSRLRDVGARLERAGLEPVRLAGADLDALQPDETPDEGRREVRFGARCARTLALSCHPVRLDPGWLAGLDVEHDLAVHLRPSGAATAAATYLTLWAASVRDLDGVTLEARKVLLAHGVASRPSDWRALPALVSGLPLALGALRAPDGVLVRSLRAAASAVIRAPAPLLYGVDPQTRLPLLVDRLALPDANLVILGGRPDEGSFLARLELMRARLAGLDVHVVDVTGRHRHAAAALGAEAMRATFDPFGVPASGTPGERAELLTALLDLLCDGLPPGTEEAVRDTIAFVYATRGFAEDAHDTDLVAPDVDDVAFALARRGVRIPPLRDTASLLARGVARTALHTPLSVQALDGVADVLRPAAVLLSLDEVRTRMRGGRTALAIVDGVDSLLPHPLATHFAARLMGAASASFTLVCRDVASVLAGPLRDRVLDAGVKVLLRQEPREGALLADALHLTPDERSLLASAAPGEGLLLLADGRRLPLRAIATPEELKLANQGGAL